jgi:hypothetical protein
VATKRVRTAKKQAKTDNFKNFKGFAPEGIYESFLRKTPAEATISILKKNKGRTIYMEWYPIGDFGVAQKELDFVIPTEDKK